jgi:UDP-N-acetylglucosamine acyltransferase
MITQDVLPFCRVAGQRPTHVLGLNAVGLRRNGFSRERIAALKDMFKFLFHSDLNATQAIEKIRELFPPCDDREEIVRFLESSKRGIIKKTAGPWELESE